MMTAQDIQGWLNGEKLRSEGVRKQYKLIALIVFLIFLYILAGYHAAKQQHYLSDLQKEVKDKKFEYLTISSELVKVSKMSYISEQLEQRGSAIKESRTPATRIE